MLALCWFTPRGCRTHHLLDLRFHVDSMSVGKSRGRYPLHSFVYSSAS